MLRHRPPYATKLRLVSFDSTSQGHLAMVVYEWEDYQYLGKVTSETDEYLPVSSNTVQVRDTLMSLVSRRRMYVPPTLCEVASVVHPVSVALFSTCQLGNLLKTLRSGPQESRSLIAMRPAKTFGTILRETPHLHRASILRPSAETFKRVRLVSIPIPVPPASSFIVNQYSISSEKQGTTALVCLYISVKKRRLTALFTSCRACHSTAELIAGVTETSVHGYTPVI
jgi:hypothetical protein